MLETSYLELDLAGGFRLTSSERPIEVPIALPGDVHTALLAAALIPDPYFADNEQKVMWVNKTPWSVEREFSADAAMATGHLTLTLERVDCIATIWLNGEAIAHTQNTFVRYDIDVTGKVKVGENTLRIDFAVTREVAAARAAAHPFPIPFTYNYLTNGLEGVHMNFVRKPACHAGWDWGICLMPTGVYGRMVIRRSRLARLDSVQVDQEHRPDAVTLTISTRVFAFGSGTVEIAHRIADQLVAETIAVQPGENHIVHQLTLTKPALWWPNGQGSQPLYDLETALDGEISRRRVGLRKLEWVVEPDAIDHSFKCRINGRDITMMGANWIPADAIPSRITPDAVRDLLVSAREANMNMIRVWGGGQYEPDYFYELCDELGLLVWQDFMFSCMSYPSDRAFLEDVHTEITQQVRRLSHHACLALWCGDNEVIGSLNWYPETRSARERYVANYDRLNAMLGQIVADEDPARRFWPSSPSLGYLDFSDGWHSDTRGDLHYWDVWHSAKPFEAYRTINPRFASEFGFQSFTSMNVIERFTEPKDRNPSSPVMETHQRNDGGNARILETMTRYFRFPRDFAQMVYLSQIQQGLAIKTAVDYWRSTKPRCMGTLYWQLNDTWPVASWSSLDHGGQWKLLHSIARRFYRPLSVVAIPDAQTGAIAVRAINDTGQDQTSILTLEAWTMAGACRPLHQAAHLLSADEAITALTLEKGTLAPEEFLVLSWTTPEGERQHNDFFPRAYKYYELPQAQIAARWSQGPHEPELTLEADQPALFVSAQVSTPGYFSDNGLLLLPGRPVTVSFRPRLGAAIDLTELSASLRLSSLYDTY